MFLRRLKYVVRRLQLVFVLCVLVLLVVAIAIQKPDLPPVITAFLPRSLQAFVQKPLAIETIAAVSLEPAGSALVGLTVSRHGRTGPITVQLADLPEGVAATVRPLQGEESMTRIDFSASESLGDSDLEATVSVRASIGEESATQQFLLLVPRVGRPVLVPPARIILKPGMEEDVLVGIRRNGFNGPLMIRAPTPPAGVSVSELQMTEGTSSGKIRVAISGDAPEGDFWMKLGTSAYGREITTARSGSRPSDCRPA